MNSGQPPSRLRVLLSALVTTPWIGVPLMRLATRVDRFLLVCSGGRLRLSFVIPCVLLRCRGAHSGLIREVPLLCVPHEAAAGDRAADALIVVGSGAGRRREPAWCANLRANPEVETLRAGRTERRVAVQLEGARRLVAWQLALNVFPGYGRYAERLEREIPIFSLEIQP